MGTGQAEEVKNMKCERFFLFVDKKKRFVVYSKYNLYMAVYIYV